MVSRLVARLPGIILFVWVAHGCEVRDETGGDVAANPSEFVAGRDSMGVLIVETPGEVALAPLPWTVDAVPYIRVGSVEGDEPYLFDNVRGVAGLPEEEVLVLDGGSRELRVFDREGVHLRSEGGPGRGPGEFGTPWLILVGTPTTDSVLIFDTALRRFTAYDRTARNPEVLTGTPSIRGGPLGVAQGHVLSMSFFLGMRPGAEPEGLYHDSLLVEWQDIQSGQVNSDFDRLPAAGSLRDPGVQSWRLPFQVDLSAVAADSGFFLAEGWSAEIRQYGTDGSLDKVLRIDEALRPVSRAEFQAALEWDLDRNGGDRWGFGAMGSEAYTQLPQPVLAPAFQGLIVDATGLLWAWLWESERRVYDPYDTTMGSRWMVFDPDGRARGTVELPAGLNVQWIGSDVVLGVKRTDLDVEVVEGYRLSRTE